MGATLSHSFFRTFLLFFVLQPFVIKSLKLESVQNLNRAQKGDIISGINQIKEYLKRYGYYPHETKYALDDQFDDPLEYALKAYQKYRYLNVSGKIDSDTIKAMMIPRCGVRDYPENRVVSNYSLLGTRWRKYDLTYSIKNGATKFRNGVNVFTEAQVTPTVDNALKTWAGDSPFKFSKAAQGTVGDLTFGFFDKKHGDNDFIVEFAHAYKPENGSVHMNAFYNWSFSPNASQVDVGSVALHEFGHTLGLGHSRDKNAVMYDTFDGGILTKRVLTQDDKNGIQALYGYKPPV